MGQPMPLTGEELERLYAANAPLSEEMHKEAEVLRLKPSEVLNVEEMEEISSGILRAEAALNDARTGSSWTLDYQPEERQISLARGKHRMPITYPGAEEMRQMKKLAISCGEISGWCLQAAWAKSDHATA